MKKIIISVVALAVSMMSMATESAYVRIRLTSASGTSSVVRLTEDDARTAAFEDGYDSEKAMMYSNSKSLHVYGIVGTQYCEDVMTNSLKNQKIGFATNQVDQDYTFSFENYSGATLKLYDKETGNETTISNSATYSFSVTAAQVGRKEINDRFVINYEAPKLNVCFTDNVLIINENPYSEDIVIKNASGTTVLTKGHSVASIDFDAEGLTATGRYTVEFHNGDRKFVVEKK